MKKDDNESNIRVILKESGLSKTSEQFATHLSQLIIEQSKTKLAKQYDVNNWVGKVLAGIAFTWLVIFIYYMRPFSIQPAVPITAVAFLLGLWAIFALVTRSVVLRIDSI